MVGSRVNIGGVEIDIRADGSLLIADLQKAELQAQVFSNNVSKNFDGVNKNVGQLTSQIKAMGASLIALGVGAGLAQSVKTLASFGQTMSTVLAVTQATQSEFDKLTAKAKELGSTTRFTATQAAEGMVLLGQAGFTTSEILEAITPTLQLAQAGGLGLAQAAEIASSTLHGFNLEVSQTAHVMDVLAKAAIISNADVTTLGEGLKFAAPTATALGLSLEETVAILAKLADSGLTGGLGGRGFGAIATQLVSQRDKVKAIIGDYDVAADGLGAVIRRLTEAGITTSQVVDIFRGENLDVFTILQNSTREAGKGLDAYTEALKNSDGTAKRVSETMDQNLNGAILSAASAFESLVLAIGEAGATEILIDTFRGIGDALRFASGAIGDFTSSVAEKIAKLANDAKVAIEKMAAAQNSILDDVDALTVANEALNVAIANGGEAAIIAAQQDVNALNTRIAKNKELIELLRIQAISKLADARAAAAEAEKPGNELDRLLASVPQSAPRALTYPGKLFSDGKDFTRVEPGRVPFRDPQVFGETSAGSVDYRSAIDDGTFQKKIEGAYGNRDTQQINALAAIRDQLKAGVPLSETQKQLQEYLLKKAETDQALKDALSNLGLIEVAITGGTRVNLNGPVIPGKPSDKKPTTGSGDDPSKVKEPTFQLYTTDALEYAKAIEEIGKSKESDAVKSSGALRALLDYLDASKNIFDVMVQLKALTDDGLLLPDQASIAKYTIDKFGEDALNKSAGLKDGKFDPRNLDPKVDEFFKDQAAQNTNIGIRPGDAPAPDKLLDGFDVEVANATKRGLYDAISSGDYGDLLGNIIGDAASDGLSRAVDVLVDELFKVDWGGAFKALFGGEGGFDIGGFAKAIFGGGKASGGDVSSHRAYRVGEMGAELFIPETDGYIIPNKSGAKQTDQPGGRMAVNIGDTNLTVNGLADGVTTDQLEAALDRHRRGLGEAIDARVADQQRRGNY